ncbi:GNAT family N-acetyltransferase [Solihabitans fulvus]|uniref:GNAT family N-acetyltransferase n=1 Tax=Solihabitans fulvus TaxID=1892852 RepID=A0A5B2X9N3_9PSEU|nr:GNAT family N-acetyltransferase [Solihabitans fulvus]KAA2259562.1 GNAT family N-acetyltransferase [Solihabitans fulvus]
MSDVVVRPARAEELPAVGALTVAAYLADGYLEGRTEDGYATKLADAEDRAAHAELLVAVDPDDTILGSVTVVRSGTKFAEISRADELEFRMLGVAPEARGRGIGTVLTAAVVDRARELGLPRVVLSSLDRMTNVHRLYRRLGFERLPERDWRPAPHVQLVVFGLALS